MKTTRIPLQDEEYQCAPLNVWDAVLGLIALAVIAGIWWLT